MSPLFQRSIYIGAATVLALSIYMQQFSRTMETTQLVQLEERRGESLANVIANALWRQHGDFFKDAAQRDNDALKTAPQFSAIDTSVRRLVAGSNIGKVKIFSTDGRTIYSTAKMDIGSTKSAQVDFNKVVSTGRPLSAIDQRDVFHSISGTGRNRHIVSTYVPIMGDGNAVNAVVEIYTDITDEFAQLNSRRMVSSILVTVLLCGSFGLVLAFFRRSSRAAEIQAAELANFNEKLEAGIAERTEVLTRQQGLLSDLIGDDLYRSGDLTFALGRIAEIMAEGLSAGRVSVWIVNEAETRASCLDVYERDKERHSDGPVVELGECADYWRTLQRRRIVMTMDAEGDPVFASFNRQIQDMAARGAAMDVPIMFERTVIGMLRADSQQDGCNCSPEAQLFAVSLANLATLALERSERRQLEVELISANRNQEQLMRAV